MIARGRLYVSGSCPSGAAIPSVVISLRAEMEEPEKR